MQVAQSFFSAQPTSFTRRILTTPFYVHTFCPTDQPFTSFEDLKARIRDFKDSSLGVRFVAYSMARAVFTLFVLTPAATLGFMWNGLSALATMVSLKGHQFARADMSKLDALQERIDNYVEALLEDLSLAQIPFSILAERGVSLLQSKFVKLGSYGKQFEAQQVHKMLFLAVLYRALFVSWAAFQVFDKIYKNSIRPTHLLAPLLESTRKSEEEGVKIVEGMKVALLLIHELYAGGCIRDQPTVSFRSKPKDLLQILGPLQNSLPIQTMQQNIADALAALQLLETVSKRKLTIEEVKEAEKYLYGQIWHRMHELELVLASEIVFNIYPFMTDEQRRPSYSFPLDVSNVCLALERAGLQVTYQEKIEQLECLERAINAYRACYRHVDGNRVLESETTLDEYEMLRELQSGFVERLRRLEVDAVDCIIDLNALIFKFDNGKTGENQIFQVNYDLPLPFGAAKAAANQVIAAIGDGGDQDLKGKFQELLESFEGCESSISSAREQLNFLVSLFNGRTKPDGFDEKYGEELWQILSDPYSDTYLFLDLDENIRDLECEIVKTVREINSEIVKLNGIFQKENPQIPFSYPFNLFNLALMSAMDEFKTNTSGELSNKRLLELSAQLHENQIRLRIYRDLDLRAADEGWKQPPVYTDRNEYQSWFEGQGNLESKE